MTTETPEVTREDAIKFCNSAMRNWQYVSFDEDELEDLRVVLDHFRIATTADLQARLEAAEGLVREILDGVVSSGGVCVIPDALIVKACDALATHP